MIQTILLNLHPNESTQELNYYPFGVNLDRCVGSCNTLNNQSNRVWVPNKTEDLNIHVFKIITGINESKILTKHISCKWECQFDGRKSYPDQKWNNYKCWCECNNLRKKFVCSKKIIFEILTHVVAKLVYI